MTLPKDGSIEAEYSDGYVHNETALGDISPYDPIRNILNDIIEKRPEAEHGKLVRFSLFHNDHRYDVDWTTLPENARPIRFKHMEQDSIGTQIIETRLMGVDFGFQYTNDVGENVQEVIELK